MSHHHWRSRLLSATFAIGLSCGADQALAMDFAGGFATRFTSTGSVDTTFGQEGGLHVFEPNGYATAAAVDGENRIIIAGTRNGAFVVARLTASGAVDVSFGVNGVATKAFSAGAEARAVAVDPWDRIIVTGTTAEQFAVACFNDSGGNCWFGSDSKVTTAFAHPAEAVALAIASDGRIVVGGRVHYFASANSATNEMFALARYNAFGGLDSSFGSGGRAVHDVAPAVWPATNVETISGVAIDSSGRIVAAGTYAAQNVSQRFALLRFLANGSLDTTFGPNANGMATAFGGCSWAGCFEEASATALALQSDGKIVIAGTAKLINTSILDGDVALVRFLANGSRDSSNFGIDGYVRTDVGGYQASALALKVAGTNLYVAGYAAAGDQALVARYSAANGGLDNAFDGGIVVGTSCGSQEMSPAMALVIQVSYRGLFEPIRRPVIVGTCISY